MAIRLSENEFAELVEQALEELPDEFQPYMENISVEIQPRPTKEFLRANFVEGSTHDLLGLYVGTALPDKSVSSPVDWPERIYIFQRNIEAICDTHDDVVEEVYLTVLHEIGHHFGMDEDDLAEFGYG